MRKPIGRIKNEQIKKRTRRKLSIRKKVSGTTERPRLCAIRTNKHIGIQVVDDVAGKTLFAVHTYGKDIGKKAIKCNKEGAKKVGEKVAEKLKANGTKTAIFDRNGWKYGGLISTLVDAIREQGIQV